MELGARQPLVGDVHLYPPRSEAFQLDDPAAASPGIRFHFPREKDVRGLLGKLALVETADIDVPERQRDRVYLLHPLLPKSLAAYAHRRKIGMRGPHDRVPPVGGQFSLEDEGRLVEQKEVVPADEGGVVHVEHDERRRYPCVAEPRNAEPARERCDRPPGLARKGAQPVARMPGRIEPGIGDYKIVLSGPDLPHRIEESRRRAIAIDKLGALERRTPAGPQQRRALRINIREIMTIADLEDTHGRGLRVHVRAAEPAPGIA